MFQIKEYDIPLILMDTDSYATSSSPYIFLDVEVSAPMEMLIIILVPTA